MRSIGRADHGRENAHLAEVGDNKAGNHQCVVRLGVQRVVDVVGHKRRKQPVVRAVPEEVEDGHSGMAEHVHVRRLKDSLHA